jgi:HAD superfamily hydrolase (TIGR01549 family)
MTETTCHTAIKVYVIKTKSETKMPLQHKQLKAVIFDMDGTIVDTKLNFDQIREEIGIPPKKPILEYLEQSSDSIFVEKAHQVINRHESEGAKKSLIIRDFQTFYDWLKVNKVKTGLLTRNSRKVTELIVKKFNWNFDIIITRDDAPPKPNPEGLFFCLKQFYCKEKELLFIGDHLFDLETAYNAGVYSCLIEQKYNQQFIAQADLSIEFFNELNCFFKTIT